MKKDLQQVPGSDNPEESLLTDNLNSTYGQGLKTMGKVPAFKTVLKTIPFYLFCEFC